MDDSDGDYGSYGEYDTPDVSESENESDDDSVDYGFDLTTVEVEDVVPKTAYNVLSEEELKAKQEEAIEGVVSVLAVSPSIACALLRHFKWSVSRLNDGWFQDEAAVRRDVGLHPCDEEAAAPADDSSQEVQCLICFESYPRGDMRASSCKDFFCTTCWTGYVQAAIQDGPGCLNLRCPRPDCKMLVGESLVCELAGEEEQEKYNRFKMRSYVEDNHKLKWCPAPGCSYAVECRTGGSVSDGPQDIGCKCGNSFCWSCNEEAHRPVACETVRRWVLKNSAESENMNWILANSKPCPKCKRPIEKNQGCMHMTCTPPCRYEFCWLCLGPWTNHGERTGGFYACNRYESAKQKGELDEHERRRDMAKESLERYMHYYERWAAHEKARVKAFEDLRDMMDDKLKRLSDCQSTPLSQLKFVTDAWAQIVECRRVLKWTYAYGYYAEIDPRKRNFFEFMQGDAEMSLERLHEVAEQELAPFLTSDPAVIAASPHLVGSPLASSLTSPASLTTSPSTMSLQMDGASPSLLGTSPMTGTHPSFDDFRSKLTGLTAITKNFFTTLVQNLEKGLEKEEEEAALRARTAAGADPADPKGQDIPKVKPKFWGGGSSSSGRGGGNA